MKNLNKILLALLFLSLAFGQLQRLAADLGRESDLIDVFREVAPDVLDGDLQRRLYLDIADLARAMTLGG